MTEVRPFTGNAISFGVSSNDVEVVGGAPAGTIEVTRRFEWGLGGTKPKLNETWDDGGVAISGASCQGVSWRCGVDYIVRVPDNVAVELRGGSGDVVLGGSLGTIDVEVGSGDIEADGLSSADVRLQTGSGDVDLGLDSGQARSTSARAAATWTSASTPTQRRRPPPRRQRRHRSSCRPHRTASTSRPVPVTCRSTPDADQFRLDVDTGSGDQNVDVPSSPPRTSSSRSGRAPATSRSTSDRPGSRWHLAPESDLQPRTEYLEPRAGAGCILDRMSEQESVGRRVQSRIYREGLFGRLPAAPVEPSALEQPPGRS